MVRFRLQDKFNNKTRGFTLIELLVVMAIVALLLTIALPRYFGSLNKAKDVALQENLQVLRVTLDKFYADKGHYPETLDELTQQKYLRAVPVDPVTESSASWILIPPREAEAKGIADVKSGAIGQAYDGRPYETF
ncbi:type II secretion system protein [Paraherbaspirillum soli]|uniref:Type II secretion system protein n=1 Tax=Paraherbaspirillum soli TaxID=631222 RepID=A0ABW0M7M1_9BURK